MRQAQDASELTTTQQAWTRVAHTQWLRRRGSAVDGWPDVEPTLTVFPSAYR
jgi:hypothetical protein